MKDQILKIAKVKSEKEFYKKYPTEEAFMAKHGKQLKKAAMGTAMVNKQLNQLTDWDNPKQAQWGDLIGKIAGGGATGGGGFDLMKGIGSLAGGANGSTGSAGAAAPAATGGGLGDAIGGILKQGGGKGADIAGSTAGKVGLGMLNSATDIMKGFGQMKQQQNAIKKADQQSQITGLTAQAAESKQVGFKQHNYARPEDALVQPGQMGNPQGAGTNYLAQYGASIGGNPTQIQNTYAPTNTLYDDLGYQPLNDSNVKQYKHGGHLPEAEFGDYFQSSGQASIGKGVGSAIGTAFLGPIGGQIGGLLGSVAGNLLGGADDANKLARFQDQTKKNTERAAIAGQAQSIQSQNAAFMEDGGWVSNDWQPQVITKFGDYDIKDLLQPPHDADMLRSGGHLAQVQYTPPTAAAMSTEKYAMGGDLQVHRGKAETMSYNPFLPDGGETVMFRGPSHDNGGMPISFGQNGVEVEGGEPAVKLQDGGQEDNLVVFGNMVIPNYGVSEIGDKNAKGKKFKNYIADLSKVEAKQNKIINKTTSNLAEPIDSDPFSTLAMNTNQANLIGANMKLKDIAQKKQNAAAVQNAILDTAEEHGLESDALAKGKIKKAKLGAGLPKNQSGGTTTFTYNGLTLDPKNPEHAKIIAREQAEMDKQHADLQAHFANKNAGDEQYTPRPTLDQSIISSRPTLNVPTAPQEMSQTSPEATPAYQGTPFAGQPDFGAGYTAPSFIDSLNKLFPSKQRANMPTYNVDTTPVKHAGIAAPGLATLPEGFAERALASAEALSPDTTKKKGNTLETLKNIAGAIATSTAPLFRPSNQIPLDSDQLMGEYYALANNQQEPVYAQKYQPMLESPYDISLQDQVNAVDSQARAAIRAAGNDPAAQAYIMAQATEAKNKVLGEQMRINQANKAQVYNKNRDILNDAQLKNLGILDTQQVRQSQAKSNTKAQALAALNSISDKIAKNKLENKTLGVYENMYNYRFGPNGQAYNYNAPASFNVPSLGMADPNLTDNTVAGDLLPIYGNKGAVTGYKVKQPDTTKKSRNGSIVKAIKNL